MAKDWASIRVKTEASAFNAVRAKITGWPVEVAEEVYYPQLNLIVALGVSRIHQVIRDSHTPTGRERAQKGKGEAGRIDTGRMIRNVTSRIRPGEGKTHRFTAFVGWQKGRPGYTIFQELGTTNGIRGMNAVGIAREEMLARIRSISKGSRIESPEDFSFSDGEGRDAD